MKARPGEEREHGPVSACSGVSFLCGAQCILGGSGFGVLLMKPGVGSGVLQPTGRFIGQTVVSTKC